MSRVDLALDVARGDADAVEVGNRRAAEFQDKTRHRGPEPQGS